MGGRKACTEEDRASHSLLQAGGRKQDSRARGELSRGKDRVRGQTEERSGLMLTSLHLATGPQAKAWLKEVRMTSVSVPGQGSHSDRAKMKADMSRRGRAALAWELSTSVGGWAQK